MKRSIFATLAFVVLAMTGSAQGLYIRFGGTYGLPTGTSVIGDKYNYNYDGTGASAVTTTASKAVSGSYGAGPNASLSVGYKFNANFMVDFTGQYLIGNKIETGSWYNYKYTSFSSVENNVYKDNITGLFLNPSLVFSAGFGKAAPYGRFGVVVGSPKHTSTESYYYDGDGISYYDKTWIYKKGMALGYQAAIGMNWKLSNKLDFYTEVNIVNMSWYAQKGELTKYMSNGTDYLPNLPVNQKLFDFVSSVDLNAIQDPSKPAQQLRVSYPFSTVSAQAGIRFVLFQKKSE